MLARSNKKSNERDQHSRYVELCALLTTGALKTEDLDDLNAHLAICSECRTQVADFQQIVRDTIPLLAMGRGAQVHEDIDWKQEKSKRRLFAAIEEQAQEKSEAGRRPPAVLHQALWRPLSFFVILIFVGVAGYVIGERRHPQPAVQVAAPAQVGRERVQSEPALAIQISDLTKQRDALDSKAKEDTQTIDHLSQVVAQQTRELIRLKQLADESEASRSHQSSEISSLRDESAAIRSDRDNVARQLKETQASLASLNQDISRLQAERVADLLQTTTMQKTIDELTAQLNSRESTVAEQQKFLASDRDIRELMGARDLLIADVSDVDQDGNSRKPFGRVFYTKNKSLIFYAFDLEKHPNLRNAKTFQLWGQKTSDKERPANLGIFYMDNEANRRWVLKFDNPKVMEQIDAVFVTVEPKGGSDKPNGKQLMYAYLRTPPNHP